MKKQTQKQNAEDKKKKRKILLATLIPLGTVAVASAITLPLVLKKQPDQEESSEITQADFLQYYETYYNASHGTGSKKYANEDIGTIINCECYKTWGSGEYTTPKIYTLTSLSYDESGSCLGTFYAESGATITDDLNLKNTKDGMINVFNYYIETLGCTISYSINNLNKDISYTITKSGQPFLYKQTFNQYGYNAYIEDFEGEDQKGQITKINYTQGPTH